jgi:hypothetical protein
MAMGWKGNITGLIESVNGHERKMSVSLTICGVDVPVARNLFHEEQRLRRRVSELNSTECLSNSQRGQTKIVLAIRKRVALHFIIEGGSNRATLLVVIVEELELLRGLVSALLS